jgi:hypothetical protein
MWWSGIRVTCPYCGKVYTASGPWVGQMAKCTSCGYGFLMLQTYEELRKDVHMRPMRRKRFLKRYGEPRQEQVIDGNVILHYVVREGPVRLICDRAQWNDVDQVLVTQLTMT